MRVRDIVIKDLKMIIYDKKTLAIILLMPIVLMTILSNALNFDSSGNGLGEIKQIAVVKAYDTEFEKGKFIQLIEQLPVEGLETEELLEGIEEVAPEKILFEEVLDSEAIQEMVAYKVLTYDSAIDALEKGDVHAVIILPKNFVYDTYMNFMMPSKNKVNIKIVKSAEASFGGMIVENIINAYTTVMSTICANKEVFINVTNDYMETEEVMLGLEEVMSETQFDQKMNIKINEKSINGKKQIDSFAYYSMAIMTMFIFYSAGFAGRSLLREKQQITYQRLKVAGIPLGKMYIGTFFTTLFIAGLQITTMMFYSSLVLKVDWGNLLYVFIVSLLIISTIASIGVLISTITLKTGNFRVANLFENVIVYVMAAIGGSFVPISVMPSFVQKLSNLSINGLGIKMYTNIIMGQGFESLIEYIIILVTMMVVFLALTIGIARFGKEAA